jgi:hypothetical protein
VTISLARSLFRKCAHYLIIIKICVHGGAIYIMAPPYIRNFFVAPQGANKNQPMSKDFWSPGEVWTRSEKRKWMGVATQGR